MVNNRIVEDELENCDFIKVGLMLFVVLGHSMALWGPNGWFNQAPRVSVQNIEFSSNLDRLISHIRLCVSLRVYLCICKIREKEI